MKITKQHIGYFLLISFAFIGLIGLIFSSPIPQNIDYHKFSDFITYFRISNFWNVISNLPFLIIGIMAIFKLNLFSKSKIQYLLFFIGVSLVSFGSAYYHLTPNSETLIWDRLPMTVAFMALVSILISEFINLSLGKRLLVPLVTLGFLSILYWILFDDLRFYFIIQFYPMVSIPIILLFFKSKKQSTKGYWILLLFYAIAKLLEIYDYQTHDMLSWISGHSLKHIAAAIGVWFLFKSYKSKILI